MGSNSSPSQRLMGADQHRYRQRVQPRFTSIEILAVASPLVAVFLPTVIKYQT
jgi:hypothetical protein